VSTERSHLFICFSSKDEGVAHDVVEYLESKGLTCWISLRDVPPGENYQETIVKALEAAQGIVFLFSEFSAKSGEIKKELSIGASVHAPVFPLRLSPISPTGALRYELATKQWIDMFPDPAKALDKLVKTIRKVLDDPTGAEHELAPPTAAAAAGAATAAPPLKRVKAGPPLLAPDSQEFEATRALLARHIGPIAKVLLQKAVTEAQSLDDLCQRLAEHVRAPGDRAAFLQAARTRLKA
jgi:TIR domain